MPVSPVHVASRDLKKMYRLKAVMNKDAQVADKIGTAVTNYHFEALKMIELFGAPAAEAYASCETISAARMSLGGSIGRQMALRVSVLKNPQIRNDPEMLYAMQGVLKGAKKEIV